MAVNKHMRSMKRAKQRRITADLHDLLTFPATADGISADLHGPFRENVKAFVDRHARASPAHAYATGSVVWTWRVAFKVGEAVESGETPATAELVIALEDVARSGSVYCDQCRIVGTVTASRTQHCIIKIIYIYIYIIKITKIVKLY